VANVKLSPKELAEFKEQIKSHEGTASSANLSTEVKVSNGKLKTRNIKLSNSSHAPYIDVMSMSFKYMSGKDKKGNRIPPKVEPTKENYAADIAAVKGLIAATKKYQSDKSEVNKSSLENARRNLYSRGANITVGYGHLTKGSEFVEKFDDYIELDKDGADEIFEKDYVEHENIAKRFEGFDKAPPSVQRVLIDMSYNLGSKPLKWKTFTGQIKRGDYAAAAKNLESTKYYKQVGKRAVNNVSLMEKGVAEAKDPSSAFDTALEEDRFPESSQGSTEFIKKEEPKLEDTTTDKEKLAQQSLLDREEDLDFRENRIKAPMSRISEPGLEEKKKSTVKSPSGPYNDYSGRPFAEAFSEARADGQDLFYYNGKLKHTMTAEELVGDTKVKEKPKEEGVEKYLDKAPEPLGWYEPAPGDMLGGERFSMIPRYPVPDIMDKKEDDSKSKVSDILQKTADEDYDKMSFKDAFKKQRAAGKKKFTWRGKPYTTEVKGE